MPPCNPFHRNIYTFCIFYKLLYQKETLFVWFVSSLIRRLTEELEENKVGADSSINWDSLHLIKRNSDSIDYSQSHWERFAPLLQHLLFKITANSKQREIEVWGFTPKFETFIVAVTDINSYPQYSATTIKCSKSHMTSVISFCHYKYKSQLQVPGSTEIQTVRENNIPSWK